MTTKNANDRSDLDIWLERMGYRSRDRDPAGGFGSAAKSLGYGPSQIKRVRDNPDLIDTTMRLAMAARRAGLEPWTPENDEAAAMLIPNAAEHFSKAAETLFACKRLAGREEGG